MSSYPERRDRPAESVAGFLAAAAIAVGLIGVVYKPVRLIPIAVVVALVALGLGGRHQRLAVFALAVASVAWVLGMTIAVATDRPLF